MALTAEDGTGVYGAESYVSVADADTYWGGRTHTAFYAAWDAATTAVKEGALREASTYLDATWGAYFRGKRRGYVQGLYWPRSDALDDAGYPLPDLPPEIVNATCELAGRAVSARLASDEAKGGKVKRQKVGDIEREFFEGASVEKRFGSVNGILAPVLDGSQDGNPQWVWR